VANVRISTTGTAKVPKLPLVSVLSLPLPN
jgi:hypothetical protein